MDEGAPAVPHPPVAMAVPSLIPFPSKLSLDGNISDNWKKFKRTWNNYEIASGLEGKDQKLRTATLLTCIGSEAMDIFDGFHFDNEDDKEDIEIVIEKFQTYCIGKTNVTYERYLFNSNNQAEHESFDSFLTTLRKLAKTCEYGALTDSLIKDRIVIGVRENNLRKRLLQEDGLTLDRCIDICRASESTQAKVKTMTGATGNAEDINALRKFKSKMKPNRQEKCKYCGKRCEKGKCPAFGKKCDKCGRYNHFASECRQTHKKKRRPRNNIRQLEIDSSESENSEFEIMTLSSQKNDYVTKSKVFATMLLVNAQKTLKFQLDSGATTNLIPKKFVPKNMIDNKTNTLRMYDKSEMKTFGTCQLTLKNPKTAERYKLRFIVVDDQFTPLLGLTAIEKMKLIKIQYENICHIEKDSSNMNIEYILDNFSSVFDGEGCFEGELHLEVDESVTPVKMPLRRVPIGMKGKLKDELRKMQKAGIISTVNTPTDWVSSLVVVKKPSGKLRICIDPKTLNKALKRSHYPLPVIEDLLPELSDAKVFSKCDVKNAFWHVKLDEESSYLTTFETPFGRYKWNKMPFGISPASEYFQYYLEKNLEGLEGIKPIADDILIFGKGETLQDARRDHDEKLIRLLQRCQERNIKLNKDKFQLHKDEMPFIGHLLTENGVKPDNSKIEAIMNMPKPNDKKAVQRLLGLVNYLTKFLGHLSDICEPLRQLTHKNATWNWTHQHDESFENIKKAVCNTPVLRYFDSKQETVIQCDSSDTGLGAALLQKGQPIAYASRALSKTEQNYAQIEKELLAVVFGFEKFHQFTYGRRIIVESDHKPLEIISKKPLHKAPKRLQRIRLRLQLYEFEIVYKKGKEMYIADTLSRAYLQRTEQTHLNEVLSVQSDFEKEVEKVCMADFLAVSRDRQTKIQLATRDDPTLSKVIEMIKSGWDTQLMPSETKPYFNIRDELSVENDIVFRGDRCVIPKCMRKEIMNQIHTHTGVEGCLKRARQTVYWPNITNEIKDYIGKCETCQSFARKQCKEPLISHDVPNRPWAKVGTDIFSFDGNEYLVTVDYYSNFFEIDKLEDSSSKCVIGKLKQHFARHGIPTQLISDNAQTFKSEKFRQFEKQWDIEHITSSARYPQSNGKAENAVKTVKTLMKKCKHAHSDPMLALLNLRNTPLQSTGYSPVEQSMNRKTRTLLPTKVNKLNPEIPKNVKSNIDKSKEKQAFYYNKSARPLTNITIGETVRIKPENRNETWKKGTIVGNPKNRSYNVMTENGQKINRNRRHLRKTNEQFRVNTDQEIQYPNNSGHTRSEQTNTHKEQATTPKPQSKSPKQTTCDGQTRSGRYVKAPIRFRDYIT